MKTFLSGTNNAPCTQDEVKDAHSKTGKWETTIKKFETVIFATITDLEDFCQPGGELDFFRQDTPESKERARKLRHQLKQLKKTREQFTSWLTSCEQISGRVSEEAIH